MPPQELRPYPGPGETVDQQALNQVHQRLNDLGILKYAAVEVEYGPRVGRLDNLMTLTPPQHLQDPSLKAVALSLVKAAATKGKR